MKPSPAAILKQAQVPALLISNLMNIRYLTGLKFTSALLLVHKRNITLFVDARYTEMATTRAPARIKVRSPEELIKTLKKIKKCGIESDDVTISRLTLWKKKFKGTKFVHKEGIIEHFRRSKDTEELKLMKHAHSITEKILKRIPSALKTGMTELQMAWKIETWAKELGSEDMSFESIVAFGPHTSRPHHRPTDRKLKKGEIVQIDIGASYHGYCSDRSAVYFTGPLTQKQSDALAAVVETKETAKKAAKKGASVRKLDQIARDVLKDHGMAEAFTHSLGHGVGLDIHEGINLSVRAPDDHLLSGEVITIEPGVYFPGKFGIRLEDMVFVR